MKLDIGGSAEEVVKCTGVNIPNLLKQSSFILNYKQTSGIILNLKRFH